MGFPYSSQIPGPATEAPLELDFTRPIGISEEEERESKPHYLVPIDRTCRLNDAALTGSEPAATSSNGGPLFNRIYIDGDHFFGLGREVIHGALDEASHQVLASPSHVDPDLLRGRRCNVYEPCRFSVEFFDVSQLKDKQRLYSLTSFFGGSLFNMYLQVVRNQKRSSLQLGLYLHRQAIYEAPPAPSRPSVTPGADGTQPAVGTHALFGEGSRLRSATMQASNSASGTSPGSPGFPNLHGLDIRSGGNGSTGNQAGAMTSPYIDSRKAVQAYFAVHSPTLRGTAATLFASGPDAFANSQSWGCVPCQCRKYTNEGADERVQQVPFELALVGRVHRLERDRSRRRRKQGIRCSGDGPGQGERGQVFEFALHGDHRSVVVL